MYERDRHTDRQTNIHTAWWHRPRLHSIARQKLIFTLMLTITLTFNLFLLTSKLIWQLLLTWVIYLLCLTVLHYQWGAAGRLFHVAGPSTEEPVCVACSGVSLGRADSWHKSADHRCERTAQCNVGRQYVVRYDGVRPCKLLHTSSAAVLYVIRCVTGRQCRSRTTGVIRS